MKKILFVLPFIFSCSASQAAQKCDFTGKDKLIYEITKPLMPLECKTSGNAYRLTGEGINIEISSYTNKEMLDDEMTVDGERLTFNQLYSATQSPEPSITNDYIELRREFLATVESSGIVKRDIGNFYYELGAIDTPYKHFITFVPNSKPETYFGIGTNSNSSVFIKLMFNKKGDEADGQ